MDKPTNSAGDIGVKPGARMSRDGEPGEYVMIVQQTSHMPDTLFISVEPHTFHQSTAPTIPTAILILQNNFEGRTRHLTTTARRAYVDIAKRSAYNDAGAEGRQILA